MTALWPATLLLALGAVVVVAGLARRRPALTILGATILFSHATPLLFAPASAEADTVLLMTMVASLGWCLGYVLLALAPPLPSLPYFPQPVPPRMVHTVFLATVLVLIAAAPGGPAGFLASGLVRIPVESTLFSLTYIAACATAFTTTLLLVHATASGRRPPIFSMAVIVVVFWSLGGRGQFVVTALTFLLVYGGYGRLRPVVLALLALALIVLAAFTLSFRLSLQGRETDVLTALPIMMGQVSLLDGYALSARYVETFGHHAGHYLDTLQQLLPRALFPAKPPQLSRELRIMSARDTLGGLTPGLVGESYVTGGHAMVAALATLFGGVLALLDKAWKRLPLLSPSRQAVLVAVLPVLSIFALRGGFDTAIFRVAVLFGIATFIALRPTPRQAQVTGLTHP
jgi:small basic protein